MDYPSDFNTPAFPAGPRIAISRFMAIASCALFVVVIGLCLVLLWAARSQRIDPFIVSVDEITGEWTVVGHSHGDGPVEYPALWSVQQSVIVNFATNWFTISENVEINDAMWQTCERATDCGTESDLKYGDAACALYCTAGEELFSRFVYDVVPAHQARVTNGEIWAVDKTKIQVVPAGQIADNGGTWRIFATIQSNISGDIAVVAFAKVARDTDRYPQTLGYYVADFNAYKIN